MNLPTSLFAGDHVMWIAGLLAAAIPLATLRASSPALDKIKLGDKKFDERALVEAAQAYQEAFDLAVDDTSTQIEALSQLSRCRLTQNDFEGAKSWLAKAGAIASEKYPGGWSRYLGVKGRLEWREGRNEAATETFKQMYAYAKKHDLAERFLDAARMIAISGTPGEQIEWGSLGVKEAEATGQLEMLPSLCNNLASTYADQKNYEKAYELYVQAREYHWRFSGETGKLYADYQVGWILTMLKRYDEAMTWLRPSLAWAERLGNEDVQGQACTDLGDIAAAKGDKQNARTMYERALGHLKNAGYDQSSPEVLHKIAGKLAALGQ